MQTLTTPPRCPEKLSAEQLEQYLRDGYLAFVDVLTPDEILKAKAALSRLVHRIVESDTTLKKGPFWTAGDGSKVGVQFEKDYVPSSGRTEPDIELKVRKLMWFIGDDPNLGYFAERHPRIKGVLDSILGPSAILFQDMALVKPPFIGSEKPWHQDDAYFAVEPLDAVCGVWIALDDATVENGCMHTIPGAHLEGPKIHHHGADCEIDVEKLDLARVVPVPLPAGGAMFFSGLLPHETPPNSSPTRRRALQYHYRSATSRMLPKEAYNGLFAENGTPGSCAAAPRN